MNTGNEAMGDGHRAAAAFTRDWLAMAPHEPCALRIADLTTERDAAVATLRNYQKQEWMEKYDAARADNAALVEALSKEHGGPKAGRICPLCQALATHGETGRALRAELAALREAFRLARHGLRRVAQSGCSHARIAREHEAESVAAALVAPKASQEDAE